MTETDMTEYVGLHEAKAATPHSDLIAHLLDSRIPKSEREHAAANEITALLAERDALAQDTAMAGREGGRMSALKTQVGGGHYKSMAIQPVEYIHRNGIPFIEGSVIKYVSRWRDKGGVEDLRKARHFLDLLIEMEIDDAAMAGGKDEG